jgi:hypothetical protein
MNPLPVRYQTTLTLLIFAVVMAWLLPGLAQDLPDDARQFSVMALADRMEIANIVLNDYYSLLAGNVTAETQNINLHRHEDYEINVTETEDGRHYQVVIRYQDSEPGSSMATGASYLVNRETKEIIRKELLQAGP